MALLTHRYVSRIILAASLAVLGACNESDAYRQRLTVTVDTPSGVRTGTSVIEITISQPVGFTLSSSAYNARMEGEAVAVSMPGGKTLFATLKSASHRDTTAEAFAGCAYDIKAFTALERVAELKTKTEPVEMPSECYPLLITYTNPKDPTSVRILNPTDLASSFGEGTSLRSIKIGITEDDLTTGISDKIPLFEKNPGFSAWHSSLQFSDPRWHIRFGDFKRNGRY